MPPRCHKNATIFVVDVGINSKMSIHPGYPSYLAKAKNIMTNFVKKMMFITQNDEVAIVLYGTNETKNALNVDKVSVIDFEEVKWDLLERIKKIKSEKKEGKFEDALKVAYHIMDSHINEHGLEFNYKTKQIYYLYNHFDNSQGHNYDSLVKNKNEEVSVYCIGEKLWKEMKKEAESNENINDFVNFISTVCDKYYTMDVMIKETMFFGSKPVNPVPSKVTLEFMSIQIPVSVFKVIDKELKKPTLKPEYQRVTEYLDSNKEFVNKSDIIKAYKFGHKLVTVTDEDQEKMIYNGGDKMLRIIAFVDKKEITIDNWGTHPSRLVIPSKESQPSQYTDYFSLHESMKTQDLVAVARLVLRNNETPKVGFLYCHTDKETKTKAFIFIEMPFEEQLYSQHFKAIPEKFEIHSEISDSVRNFIVNIKEMQGKKKHPHGIIPNPSLQMHWEAIAFKIQNPEKSLNELPCSTLFDVFETPDTVFANRCKYENDFYDVYDKYIKVEEPVMDFTLEDENMMETDEVKLKNEIEENKKIEEKEEDVKQSSITDSYFDDGLNFDDIGDF